MPVAASDRRVELSLLWTRPAPRRLEPSVSRAQRPLLAAGLFGLALAGLVSIPGNRVFDVNLPPHQLVGMLLSHASVFAILIGVSPWRADLLRRARRSTPAAWVGWSGLAAVAFVCVWLKLFPLAPAYMSALARESGPLEPLQAAFYVTAAWVAWQCANRAVRADETRLFRAASAVCAWLAIEEVEYFGVFELTAGGRIHGVWVRAVHDYIAVGVRVPAILAVLVPLAVLAVIAVLWYVGPRCVLRQARSLAAVPVVLAVGALAFSQILDQNSRLLSYRLEEPLELVAAVLFSVALIIKYGEAE